MKFDRLKKIKIRFKRNLQNLENISKHIILVAEFVVLDFDEYILTCVEASNFIEGVNISLQRQHEIGQR